MSTVPEYADDFVSKQDEEPNLPPLLSSFYKDEYRELSPLDLEAKCQEVFSTLTVTKSEALYLENATQKQNCCLDWFDHCVGRITASTAYAVVHTKTERPFVSLIKRICSTQYNNVVMVPALEWGRNNEDVARKAYSKRQTASHSGFRYSVSGLVINPLYPYLGASLDGRFDCDCCGQGILEIKCPYKYRECAPADIDDPSFYLTNTIDGFKLNSEHQYYFQVQMQLALCEVSYCDFVIWTPKEMITIRIQPDQVFFIEIKQQLQCFFQKCVLPECLTRRLQTTSPVIPPLNDPLQCDEASPQTEVYCYCRQGEDERQMIGCDNHNCPTSGFILSVWDYHNSLEQSIGTVLIVNDIYLK